MKIEAPESLINKIHTSYCNGLHFATPLPSLQINESDLVRGVLHIMQGLSSNLFQWDIKEECFHVKTGIYVTHYSQTSLHSVLNQFAYGATCLKLVENIVSNIDKFTKVPSPTLRAYTCCVSSWLKRLHNIALKEEENKNTPTLLSLSSSLSSLCAGAEYLLQVVNEAIPNTYFDLDNSTPTVEYSVHLLNYLYKKLTEICLVQGGEEDAYKMLLYMFTGSLLPYIETLDSWLFEGILDDPFDEMFFYANKSVTIEEAEFWEKSYILKLKSKSCPLFFNDVAKMIISCGKSLQLMQYSPIFIRKDKITSLTLSEIFCLSLLALIGYGDHISGYFWQDSQIISSLEQVKEIKDKSCSEKVWYKYLIDIFTQKGAINLPVPENPVITVCKKVLNENSEEWSRLNICRNYSLPPLNDEGLRNAIFGETFVAKKTNFAFGFSFGNSENLHVQELEGLFPFPTLLPYFQEDLQISEVLPFQKNSTLPSKILEWVLQADFKGTPLPIVILQECLVIYIKKQADYIGRNMLTKLLHDWKLLDELALLRAIYLLGSGDLLQHFLTVIFNKLDKGESIDDEFELNTILQESIRNSADSVLLSTPDSLVVSISKKVGPDEKQSSSNFNSSPHRIKGHSFGINVLDSLTFTYKVSWPLELIANLEAIKKYNQVMSFLLKVRRAKFVLDKARRWMWKDRGTVTANRKRHWLLEQKLLHFVDAFHQYVMDRVYHSAWHELCKGVEKAKSLDEVIEVHETYLLSIQRQCFVVPDKLWALIASRINTILGLALDFYSIQQTISTGGSVSAIKVRCEMELDRIERQFDECISFLLRILSFKLNVGQFPHLVDLVTRINYNYFYMSENGTLKNVPGPETVVTKLGRPFLS